MRINFTKKQYSNLIYLCAIGTKVIQQSGLKVDEELVQLLQYVFTSGRRDVNAQAYLDSNDTRKLVDNIISESSEVEEYIDNYNENSFWRVLSSKLASRDIMNKIDNFIEEGKNYGEYIELRNKLEQKYFNEFKKGNFENDVLPY